MEDFNGRKGAEKENYQQRMHCFRQGYPPKGNSKGLSGGLSV